MTPLEILGLPKTASHADIKTAFRRLAAQHHPDRGGDAAKFNQIRKAYEQALRPRKCPECQGRGHIRVKEGATTRKVPCPTCWS
jgi:DnaJ-class molecular chaperone